MTDLIRHSFHLLKIFCLAASILALGSGVLYAREITSSPEEAALLELINAARHDPLGMAQQIGLNRAQVLKDWPDRRDLLISGLPALSFDERLYGSASAHAADMLANNFYAYEDLNGRGPEDRIRAQGYPAALAGETLGMLSFNNFIDSQQAVFQLFKNMYKDELDPSWAGQRNILNPDLTDAGIGFAAGPFNFGGFTGNTYLAVCDFGTPVQTHELELLHLINQARVSPRPALTAQGFSVAEIVSIMPEFESLFAGGLPPLVMDPALYAAAARHNADMLENGYYGHTSPDGSTPSTRIREAGYVPAWLAQSLGRLSTCGNAVPPAQTVNNILKHLLYKAFRTESWKDRNLFSEKAVHAGIRTTAAQSPALGGLCGDNIHLSTVTFGAPWKPETTAVTGVVYADLNANGLYDAGEGLAGQPVQVKAFGPYGRIYDMLTDPAGGYALSITSGKYRVSVGSGENLQFKWIDLETGNRWVSFTVQGRVDDGF